jgi:hypothetical protein
MWWIVAVFVASLVLAYAFMPKPQATPPPGLNEIQVPTAEVGREIPVLFGCRDLNGNVTWYGDIDLVPIKSSGGGKK